MMPTDNIFYFRLLRSVQPPANKVLDNVTGSKKSVVRTHALGARIGHTIDWEMFFQKKGR